MNLVTGLGVNLAVPLVGVTAFVAFCRRMRRSGIRSPPFLSYLILFSTFGGWLMVSLTALFWQWSGMAFMGVFYLLLIAPLLTAGIAFNLRNVRAVSDYHRNAFVASVAYSCVMLPTARLIGLRIIARLAGAA
jgi:hypothetical protein